MRDKFWDSLKFVLIFFVVFGHMIEPYVLQNSICRTLWNFIYLFHMPLFIFVSGRFSYYNNKNKNLYGIIKLVEIYIISQIIYLLIIPGLLHLLNQGDYMEFSVKRLMFVPYYQLWYLFALICYRFIVYCIPVKLTHKPVAMVLIGLLLSISSGFFTSSGFFPISQELFQRTMSFLLFFVLGYYSREYDIRKMVVEKIPLFLAIGVVASFIAFFYNFVPLKCTMFFHTDNYWNLFDKSYNLSMFLTRCIIYLLQLYYV